MIAWPGYHHGKKPNSARGLRVGNPLARSLRFFFPLNEGGGQMVNSITPNNICGQIKSGGTFAMTWGDRGLKQVHGSGAAAQVGLQFGTWIGGALNLSLGQTLGGNYFTFMFRLRIDALNTTPNFFCSGGFANSTSQLGLTSAGLPRIHFGGVDTYAPGSGPAVPIGQYFTLTYTYSQSPAKVRVYYDDYLAYDAAPGFTAGSASFFFYGQGGQTGSPPAQAIDGVTEFLGYWDRTLAPNEVAAMVADPYQLVRAPGIPQLWAPTDYPPPATVSTSSTPTSITLNWSAVSGATSYNVYRASFSGNETLLATGIVPRTYTDSGLANGATYYYKVAAVGPLGEGPMSTEVVATATASTLVGSALMFFD